MTSQPKSEFTHEDKKMIQLKYAAKKIGVMNQTELKIWVKVFLLKISVITGWVLPSNDVVMAVLKDQFEKKLLEDYPSFNNEEIEYAFRHSSIEDWGKEVNLNIIDKVLWPYEIKRRELSRMEEQKAPPPEKHPYNPEEILNQYRGEIEVYFQALKKGYRPIRHIYFEETLRADGMIPETETMDEFIVRKLATADNLYLKEK